MAPDFVSELVVFIRKKKLKMSVPECIAMALRCGIASELVKLAPGRLTAAEAKEALEIINEGGIWEPLTEKRDQLLERFAECPLVEPTDGQIALRLEEVLGTEIPTESVRQARRTLAEQDTVNRSEGDGN